MGNVAQLEKRNAYRLLVGNQEVNEASSKTKM
jgi:hypothetical protein